MIPSPHEILAAVPRLAERHGVAVNPSEKAIRAAVLEARELAVEEHDEPAAVFFAFARHRWAFGAAWGVLTGAVSLWQAERVGRWVRARPDELRTLALDVVSGRADFAAVAAWFAKRLAAN